MHERAGTQATPEDLIDVDALVAAYTERVPDPSVSTERVSFGTSGHRGSSLNGSFNEHHILATTQAICEYRAEQGITGPLFLGRDTHALSKPSEKTALEVLSGNGVQVRVEASGEWVPTPSLSRAIIRWNSEHGEDETADGIIVTPSHNPPTDGGFKYNPPHGGPADSDATTWIADRANELLEAALEGVRRAEPGPDTVTQHDMIGEYVDDLASIIDMDAIREAGVRIGADPLGGASVRYWQAIRDRYGLNLTVVNEEVDSRWPFMTLDWDGKIRMDPSSPSAMAGVLARKDEYDLLTGNDADADRHGIVTPDAGLMNPNHYLTVAIDYLLTHRPDWSSEAGVGKTLVSSSMIDRVVNKHGRRLVEVPVGFKWFVPGLSDGTVVFGGEESAGASFVRRDGSVWTTDKDGIILALLAAEIIAVTGTSPSERYRELAEELAPEGAPVYERVDAPANPEQKAALKKLDGEAIEADELAGEQITAKLSTAPGNNAAIGGVKVTTESAWFAARPSGTEDVYKIYAESFRGEEHLRQVQEEATEIVGRALEG